MFKWRFHISIFMILVFASLILGTVVGGLGRVGNCFEFGHIHRFLVQAPDRNTGTARSDESHNSSDEACHGSQTLAGMFLFPSSPQIMNFVFPKGELKILAIIKSRHPAPWLEPVRKPPKFA
jgi:hypothetical protein